MRGAEPSAAWPDEVAGAVLRWLTVAAGRLRCGWAEQVELQERWLLRQRPWEELFVHWYDDGHAVHLHGRIVPHTRRRLSVTSTG